MGGSTVGWRARRQGKEGFNKKKSIIPMGEREDGSTGLRSMMGDEEVGLVNKDE